MLRWSIFCLLFGFAIVSLGVAGISGVAIESGKLLIGALLLGILAVPASLMLTGNRPRGEDR
jgi:uncharacterized membrane protein